MRRGLLLVALLAAAACSGDKLQQSQDGVTPVGTEYITYRSEAHRYEVTYPPEWHVVGERLTPNLDDPREILTLATYEPPAGGNRCEHHPVAALEALGRTDALVSIFERRPPWSESGYPPRASVDVKLDSGTGRFCVVDERRLDAWLSFRDSDRAFYLLVAVGPEASTQTRQDVKAILDNLTFQAP